MKDMIKNEKPLMGYKVRELSGKINKTQVGIWLGIHRDTVRCYLSMNLDEFLNSKVLRKSYKILPVSDSQQFLLNINNPQVLQLIQR